MLSRRHALMTPALVLLLGVLTACAGGATADAGAAPSAAAWEAVAPTPGSEGPTMLTADDFVRTVMEAQAAQQSYDFTISWGSGDDLVAMTGSAHVGGATPAIAMTTLMQGLPPMTIRFVDGLGYVSLGELTGDKFAQVDPQDPSHPLGAALTDAMRQADPLMGLAEYEAAVLEVEPVGEPFEIDGTQAQAYQVVVDPSAMPEKLAELEAGLPPGTEMPATLTYEYVVDTDGLTRQVTFDVLGVRGRMAFTNWGHATPIERPRPDEITTEDPFAG